MFPSNEPTDVTVELEEVERTELRGLRNQCVAAGILAILCIVTTWSVYFTPIIAGGLTLPTIYVAHSRMADVKQLLKGESCWCMCCGPNPRNTLKNCRPMMIACCVVSIIAVITQIAFLASYGPLNDAVGVVGVICLLLTMGLAFVNGFFSYNFGKAVAIFDAVTNRQYLRQQEMGIAGAIHNVVNSVSSVLRPQHSPPPNQQVNYGQPPPQQYGNQPAYGQPQQQYGNPQPTYGQPQYQTQQPAYGNPQPPNRNPNYQYQA